MFNAARAKFDKAFSVSNLTVLKLSSLFDKKPETVKVAELSTLAMATLGNTTQIEPMSMYNK
jgi:hypothetical protein